MLTPGAKLGHYEILAPIGAGGMGEVYRARDERLERDVAVKVLPAGTLADEAARKRFRKEALALSKFNHPNIATIFDFDTQGGVDFLVMEHISGETLADKLKAGRLPESQVLRVGAQVAEGLEAGHRESIVHRDIKPGNLRLTPDGRVKILDFGLAKAMRPAGEVPGATATESLTRTQAVVGTLPYMAPEQLRGEPADARTDIYALGCVLYEMATGRRPFPQTQAAELIGAILHQEPRPPRELNARCSPGLERVILKALAKDPEMRYQSARELRVDLHWLQAAGPGPAPERRRAWVERFPITGMKAAIGGAVALLLLLVLFGGQIPAKLRQLWRGGAPRIESLAVLPLENLSRDPEQDYFADGMTEALIAELSKIGALKVISRTSAMQYKGAKKPMPQIARELGVDGLVEGSVLREGDQVRITVQLIHGPTDRHLWTDSYQRELRGILALQSEVARAIAREIKIAVTPAESTRLASARRVNPEAHELYLKGRYQWNKRTPEGFKKAAELFQGAIDLDPTYALAYAGLADNYVVQPSWGRLSPREANSQAKAAAQRALEIDDSLAEPHATLGHVLWQYEWDWQGAEGAYRKALELNSNYANAHLYYAWYLASMGRHAESIAEIKRAQELDPLSPIITSTVGRMYYFARQYKEAEEAELKALEIDSNFYQTHTNLALVYLATGRAQEAVAAFQRLVDQEPLAQDLLALAYAAAGKREEARRIVERLEKESKTYVPATSIALIHARLGDKDRAFQWLEKALEERPWLLVQIKVEPRFDPLRDDPRFQAILRRMNFPD